VNGERGEGRNLGKRDAFIAVITIIVRTSSAEQLLPLLIKEMMIMLSN
jgi:hypothetical protein